MTIRFDAEFIRSTPGAVIDNGILIRRPLTADEIELWRQSEWLRHNNPHPHHEGQMFATVIRIYPGTQSYRIRLVRSVNRLPEVLLPHEVDAAISDIQKRFADATARRKKLAEWILENEGDYPEAVDQAADEINWGQGWPPANELFDLVLEHEIDPVSDPRPFAAVARDWCNRNGGTVYAAAKRLGVPERTLGRWVNGSPCAHERAYRALMTLLDEGRDANR